MRVLMLLLCLLPVFAQAGEAQDMAKDPVLEKRMVGLAENLRCLVCQNESLASSHAELAEDLRRWESGEPIVARGQGVVSRAPERRAERTDPASWRDEPARQVQFRATDGNGRQ